VRGVVLSIKPWVWTITTGLIRYLQYHSRYHGDTLYSSQSRRLSWDGFPFSACAEKHASLSIDFEGMLRAAGASSAPNSATICSASKVVQLETSPIVLLHIHQLTMSMCKSAAALRTATWNNPSYTALGRRTVETAALYGPRTNMLKKSKMASGPPLPPAGHMREAIQHQRCTSRCPMSETVDENEQIISKMIQPVFAVPKSLCGCVVVRQ
jgi:hypothetical protein